MKEFNNKVVFITGGSQGIGLAAARLLAGKGASISIFARRKAVLDDALKSIEAARTRPVQKLSAYSMDVSHEKEVGQVLGQAVSDMGVPDVLINCAGRARPGRFEDISFDQFNETLKIDLYGTWNTCSFLVPLMKERGGYIVNTSSIVGFVGVFGYSDYAAAKFGVMGLSETLRSELKSYNIAVSVLCPPDTDTPGFAEENKTKPPETRAISAAANLMKPEAVAAALLKGMAKEEFMIIPNADGKLTWIMKRFMPQVVNMVMDSQIRKVHQQNKAK